MSSKVLRGEVSDLDEVSSGAINNSSEQQLVCILSYDFNEYNISADELKSYIEEILKTRLSGGIVAIIGDVTKTQKVQGANVILSPANGMITLIRNETIETSARDMNTLIHLIVKYITMHR